MEFDAFTSRQKNEVVMRVQTTIAEKNKLQVKDEWINLSKGSLVVTGEVDAQ